jgi:DNA-binding MarR family transcriptional regulator
MTLARKTVSNIRLRLLADFRYQLRQFLQFSEQSANRFNLHPQQHQLLLQIAGAPSNVHATVGYATERLGLRHNTVVELSKRSEEAGLVTRNQSADDRRKVILNLTPKGRKILEALAEDHARELNELGPKLISALSTLSAAAQSEGKPILGGEDEN